MKRRIAIAGLLLLAGCLETGCSIVTKHHGEVGFRFGTDIAFYSRAANTAPEPATATTEFPSLESWIFEQAEAKKDEASQPTPNP